MCSQGQEERWERRKGRERKKKMKGMRGSLWASLGIYTLEELTRPQLNALSSQASKINSVICSLWIYTAR